MIPRQVRPALALLSGLALPLLTGCPSGVEGAAHTGVAPVETAAVYRFRGLADAEHRYVVTRVGSDAIRYTLQTTVDDQAADPLPEQRFPLAPAPALPAGEDGALRIRDRAWPVRISKDGPRTIYTAAADGRPAFPGVLKIERDGKTVWELTAVNPPGS